VVGRNCRFLQGPATNPEHVQQLRTALSAEPPQAVTVTLLNYTKSGRPFWNALHVAPMRDADGKLEYFIGIQLDVSEATLQEDGSVAAAPDGMPAGAWFKHKLCRWFRNNCLICD
jgi:PAS domain S-box-containing protein